MPGRLVALLCLLIPVAAFADPVIKDAKMADKLYGKYALTLQWLGTGDLKTAGSAEVSEVDGDWRLAGRQDAAEGFVEIEGVVKLIDATSFSFSGEIVTQVSYINNGKPCSRSGDFTFLKKGKRKYWRLQQMDNPCDVAADYVDIYLR